MGLIARWDLIKFRAQNTGGVSITPPGLAWLFLTVAGGPYKRNILMSRPRPAGSVANGRSDTSQCSVYTVPRPPLVGKAIRRGRPFPATSGRRFG